MKYNVTGNWWTFVSASAWENSINDVIGGIGMLLSARALKSLNSIERIQHREWCVLHFITTHAQQSSLATVPPMPAMERTSLSTTCYLPDTLLFLYLLYNFVSFVKFSCIKHLYLILICAYTICQYGSILISWIIPSRLPPLPVVRCLHSFMWLIVSFLSSDNLYMPFCCVLSIFSSISLFLMALFCAAIKRDSFFLDVSRS